jgi:hypothetical protein
MVMNSNVHMTAIARKTPSAPCRWLYEQGRCVGRVLDWGCGKGVDAAFLGAYAYDPYFQPVTPCVNLRYDTILCTYVLNVIPEYYDRCVVVEEALEYLAEGGWLYVSIRNDRKSLKGWTKTGTWQGYVGDQLRVGGFTMIHRTSNYEIWGWQLTSTNNVIQCK